MNITDVAIGAGIGLVLLKAMGKKSDDEVTEAVDEIATDGEVVAASPNEEEIIVAGLGGEAVVFLQDPETGEIFQYEKVGTVLVEEAEDGSAVSTPDEETAENGTMSGSYFGGSQVHMMGRSPTQYTAKEPYRRGRNLRTAFKPIGRKLPSVDSCSRAGRTLRNWYLKKKAGKVKPKNAKPTARVSQQAALLASTPCEVYRKVATGEMTPDGAMSRLTAYYAGRGASSELRRAVEAKAGEMGYSGKPRVVAD